MSFSKSYDATTTVLMDMLTYKRPHLSQTEAEFIDKYIMPMNPTEDSFGNFWIQIGADPNILWSSHLDTVHHTDGRQTISLNKMGMITVNHQKTHEKTNCLGADCTAGVWLMCEMIKHEVEGLYIFHRDEEAGGTGSQWIADNFPTMLKGIDFAIALDRKGTSDIITHQMGRTASDAFAESLAKILGGSFRADDSGLFTDTANYTNLVGECSNISVGYYRNHGPMESLDLDFLIGLRDTLITADFSTLVAERQPGPREYEDIEYYAEYKPRRNLATTFQDWADNQEDELVEFIKDNPHSVARFLTHNNFEIFDIEDYRDYLS